METDSAARRMILTTMVIETSGDAVVAMIHQMKHLKEEAGELMMKMKLQREEAEEWRKMKLQREEAEEWMMKTKLLREEAEEQMMKTKLLEAGETCVQVNVRDREGGDSLQMKRRLHDAPAGAPRMILMMAILRQEGEVLAVKNFSIKITLNKLL